MPLRPTLRGPLVALIASLCTFSSLAAQATGRIIGRVVDAAQGAPVAGAEVDVVDAPIQTVSALDGRYTLTDVPAGPVSVRVRMIGFAPKVVTGIVVQAGQTVAQDIAMVAAAVQLAEISVSAQAERGTVNRALDEQRHAPNIRNTITAEQIAKSPDSDAGQAVRRVSGVTVQDGKYVFVRGLGERYTTTSLNGARVPSPEPERKVVPLDLFPSGLLQSVTTSKTFTPDQPGDFSGAQVDIRTREFPAHRQFLYSLTMGLNDAASRASVPAPPSSGGEWIALTGRARDLPSSIASAGNFSTPLAQPSVNQMVSSFRDAWSAQPRTVLPNTSSGVSVGGEDPVFGQRIGYLASLSYSYNQEVRADEIRAYALPGSTPGSTDESDHYDGSTGRSSVLWGGLVNLSTLVGPHSKFALNTVYNRSADNEARLEVGSSENLGGRFQVSRLQYVERAVRSIQLSGEHQLGLRHRVEWALTSSGVRRKEPDRSEIVYALDGGNGTARWFSGSNEGAVRTFSDLVENGFEAGLNYRLMLGESERAPILKVGGLYRSTDRDADSRPYSISAPSLSAADRALSPEEIFDGRFVTPGSSVFRLSLLSQGGSYSARDRMGAGYGMLDVGLSDRLRLVGGARVEASRVRVDAQSTLGQAVRTEPRYTDVLPSAALNYSLTEDQNVRLSASQTLSRPEYRELAEVQYRDVLGGDNVVGNPDLRRALIRNADLRWEWYPRAGEVLSVGLFAKRFESPIELIYLATSGTRVLKYVNAESAKNYGVELEFRKGLGLLARWLNPFTAFANTTVMHSEVSVGTSDASRTNDKRPMVGQAPYVVNAGLTYTPVSADFSATLLYNRVGRRLTSAAEAPLPDVYEEARDGLDLSLRFPVAGGLAGRLDAKNLLDSPTTVTQGTVTREYYRAGRVFQLGFTWGS
jgi:outer membrane receptor protein involved in Fe transport